MILFEVEKEFVESFYYDLKDNFKTKHPDLTVKVA